MKKVISFFKHTLAFPAVLLLLSYGCTKWVDEIKPQTSQDINSLTTSTTDLETLVNGMYTGIISPSGHAIFIDLSEVLSDNFTINPAKRSVGLAMEEYSAYSHNFYQIDAGLVRYTLQWNSLTIYPANLIIQTIDGGSITKDPNFTLQAPRQLGEALTMRALSYWQCALWFGPQYAASTINTPSVVYRNVPVLGLADVPAPRKTVGEIYALIIKDLQRAIPLLPDHFDANLYPAGFKMRIRQDFAVATLAKVYFQMNNFDSALYYCNKLLGPVSPSGSSKYPLALNVQNVWNTLTAPPFYDWGWKSTTLSRDQKEIIYGCDGLDAFRMTRQDKWGFMRAVNPVGTPGISATEVFCIGRPYINLMIKGDTVHDQRWTRLISRIRGNRWTKKLALSALEYPFYRSAEFLLMRAECNARSNNLSDALTDLNVVRQRAGIPVFTSADQNAVIQEIIDERGREMICEGVRYFDMLRLSALSNGSFLVPLGEKTAEDKVYVNGVDGLPFDSPFLLWHYPGSEAQINPLF